MSKEQLSNDNSETPQFSHPDEESSLEEKYKAYYFEALSHRVRKEDFFEDARAHTADEFIVEVDRLATRISGSELFQFYIGQGLIPKEDEGNIYQSISSILRNREDTNSTAEQNLHHEAFVRFRLQGHPITQYTDILEHLGVVDEMFEGDRDTPNTISYNRGIILSSHI